MVANVAIVQSAGWILNYHSTCAILTPIGDNNGYFLSTYINIYRCNGHPDPPAVAITGGFCVDSSSPCILGDILGCLQLELLVETIHRYSFLIHWKCRRWSVSRKPVDHLYPGSWPSRETLDRRHPSPPRRDINPLLRQANICWIEH